MPNMPGLFRPLPPFELQFGSFGFGAWHMVPMVKPGMPNAQLMPRSMVFARAESRLQATDSMRNPTTFRKPRRGPRAPRDAKKRKAARDAWLRDIDAGQHFHRVLDPMPGVHCFAKNFRGEAIRYGEPAQSRRSR
jgi:hypothetical protein